MAGMCPIMPPGRGRPGYDHVPWNELHCCNLPREMAWGLPRCRWTGPELKRELEARALVSAPVSVSSLLRFLAEDPVKPWQYQSWIFPRDPDFAAKANVILDLCQGFYQGEPLGPGDRILSFDAK